MTLKHTSTLMLSMVLKQLLMCFQGLLALSKVLKQETGAPYTTCMPLEEITYTVYQGWVSYFTSCHLLKVENCLQVLLTVSSTS